MSIILRHILRNIRKNRMAGILIVVSLMISTAVIYLNLNIQNDLLAVSKKLFSGIFGGYDICVSEPVNGVSAEDPAFRDCTLLPVTFGIGTYSSDSTGTVAMVRRIESLWELAEERGVIQTESGVLPGAPGEVGLTRKKPIITASGSEIR